MFPRCSNTVKLYDNFLKFTGQFFPDFITDFFRYVFIVSKRYIRMNDDDIYYVFNLLSIKKELRTYTVCDFLSCFDDFSFHVEVKRIVDFVGRYLREYRMKN